MSYTHKLDIKEASIQDPLCKHIYHLLTTSWDRTLLREQFDADRLFSMANNIAFLARNHGFDALDGDVNRISILQPGSVDTEFSIIVTMLEGPQKVRTIAEVRNDTWNLEDMLEKLEGKVGEVVMAIIDGKD